MTEAAHAAAIIQALKASGAIVRVEPQGFAHLVARQDEPAQLIEAKIPG